MAVQHDRDISRLRDCDHRRMVLVGLLLKGAAMPSENEVYAVAREISASILIDAPKLPAQNWMGLARSLLETAEKIRAAEYRKQMAGFDAKTIAELKRISR